MNPFREIKEVKERLKMIKTFGDFSGSYEMLGMDRLYPKTDIIVGKFAVEGHHPDLGSGILFWHLKEHHALYNKAVINANGGSAKVLTRGEAMTYLKDEADLLLEMNTYANGGCDAE